MTQSVNKDEHQQLILLLFIVFIGFVGIALPYPLFPPLFLHAGEYTLASVAWSEQTRAIWLGITLAVYPFGQFIGAPILGALSDQYGRKKLLVISLVGTGLGYGLSALAIQHNLLTMLVVSRFLTGLMEGNIAIARAMASELTTIPKMKSFGWINAITSIGFIAGPMIGGGLASLPLAKTIAFALPFYLAAGLALIIALFTQV